MPRPVSFIPGLEGHRPRRGATSAAFAAGKARVLALFKYHRPRGSLLFGALPNRLMTVDGAERVCTEPIREGAVVQDRTPAGRSTRLRP
jgi:hypothetical protein